MAWRPRTSLSRRSPSRSDTFEIGCHGRAPFRALACLCVSVVAAALPALSASAITLHDESIDGDLSSDPSNPTAFVLGSGHHVFRGTIQNSEDTRDVLTFTVPEGLVLGAILQLDYSDAATGGVADRGYYALAAGATSEIPSNANASAFLGGRHLDTLPAGSDMLLPLADGGVIAALGAPGFVHPLAAGTYTLLLQQTGPEQNAYELDFVTSVPEPSTALLVGLGAAVLARRPHARRPSARSRED